MTAKAKLMLLQVRAKEVEVEVEVRLQVQLTRTLLPGDPDRHDWPRRKLDVNRASTICSTTTIRA